MECKYVREQIRLKILNNEPVIEDESLMSHLKKCELCRNFCTDTLLNQSLKEMPVPEPRADFASETIQNAINVYKRKSRRAILIGFSATAVFLIAVSALFFSRHQAGDFLMRTQTAIIMPADGQKTLHIMIEAAEPRRNATFTIDLYGNVSLKSHPEQNRLHWQTSLPRGRNLLELPLVLRKGAEGYVNVRYKYDGTEKKMRIQVEPENNNKIKKL